MTFRLGWQVLVENGGIFERNPEAGSKKAKYRDYEAASLLGIEKVVFWVERGHRERSPSEAGGNKEC